jgi:hypothetical protein
VLIPVLRCKLWRGGSGARRSHESRVLEWVDGSLSIARKVGRWERLQLDVVVWRDWEVLLIDGAFAVVSRGSAVHQPVEADAHDYDHYDGNQGVNDVCDVMLDPGTHVGTCRSSTWRLL